MTNLAVLDVSVSTSSVCQCGFSMQTGDTGAASAASSRAITTPIRRTKFARQAISRAVSQLDCVASSGIPSLRASSCFRDARHRWFSGTRDTLAVPIGLRIRGVNDAGCERGSPKICDMAITATSEQFHVMLRGRLSQSVLGSKTRAVGYGGQLPCRGPSVPTNSRHQPPFSSSASRAAFDLH